MPKQAKRTKYEYKKYSSLHLLLSRWLRLYHTTSAMTYVTLGGSELQDVMNLMFVDPDLLSPAFSYEEILSLHKVALKLHKTRYDMNANIIPLNGDIFNYKRKSELPHVYFFDFKGIVVNSDYSNNFGKMFRDLHIQEGDTIFITSHIGRGKGWKWIYTEFEEEFKKLGIVNTEQKQECFRRYHPSFTLFAALDSFRLAGQLSLRCFGSIRYKDTSPMGIYGYAVTSGSTTFENFINDDRTRFFDMNKKMLLPKLA